MRRSAIRHAGDHRSGVVLRAELGDVYATAVVSDLLLVSTHVPWAAMEITAIRVARHLGGPHPDMVWDVGIITAKGQMVFGADLETYGIGVPTEDPATDSLALHYYRTPLPGVGETGPRVERLQCPPTRKAQ